MLIGALSNPAYLLVALVCPVAMGVMMVFMGRGMGKGRRRHLEPRDRASALADLEAEHERLAGEIEALKERDSSGMQEDRV